MFNFARIHLFNFGYLLNGIFKKLCINKQLDTYFARNTLEIKNTISDCPEPIQCWEVKAWYSDSPLHTPKLSVGVQFLVPFQEDTPFIHN